MAADNMFIPFSLVDDNRLFCVKKNVDFDPLLCARQNHTFQVYLNHSYIRSKYSFVIILRYDYDEISHTVKV